MYWEYTYSILCIFLYIYTLFSPSDTIILWKEEQKLITLGHASDIHVSTRL